MKELEVNEKSCIACGKCVAICPAHIFAIHDKKVDLVDFESCIVCGHCVAVCPTNSVNHSEFPFEKQHEIDYSQMPTPDQVMLLCKARRSNRAFSEKAVSKEFIDKILEAAHVAPTASNQQQVHFTVVTDPVNLQFIRDYTVDIFSGIVKKLQNPILKPILSRIIPEPYKYIPTFNRLVEQQGIGADLILRNATGVIFIHTPEDSRFGCQDANLAYQNGSLMAEALGVSQFYTGFVCSAIGQDKTNRLAEKFGIKGKIHAGMAFGMPAFRFARYIDRKEIVRDDF